MQEQNPIVLMNFSGIYREEEFWKNRQVSWIELQDVCGTNCYCDEEAIAEINKRTENYPTAGIHFIDSGNYHYMTRLWLTRMDQPFCLLVYDNHTDMLSATYLMRISFCIFLLKAALLKQFCYSFLHISLFHSTVSKALTDSVTQCPSGIKRTHRILKNHLYISIYLFQLTLLQSCNIFSFKFQCTLCDISQPGEQLCYGTFPAAGFSYDSQRFSFF